MHPKIHEKYKFPAFPHPESHELVIHDLRPENLQKINPERCEFQTNALIDPCKIVTNKESILQNFALFALFALCTHFQDHSSSTVYM